MNRLAAVAVRAFRTVHAGFDREEHAGVDGLLDLSREENESLEVIVRPERVELVVSGLLPFGEHVEPEERIHAVHLLIGIGEHGRLKISVGFAVRPLHRSGLPVADRFVPAINGHEVEFSDQRFAEAGHIHAERFGHAFDRVIVRPFGKGHIEHIASALLPEPVVFIRFVRQVFAGLGFPSEEEVEILPGILNGVVRALHCTFGQHGMKRSTERDADRGALHLGVFDVTEVVPHRTRQVGLERRVRPVRRFAHGFDFSFHEVRLPFR